MTQFSPKTIAFLTLLAASAEAATKTVSASMSKYEQSKETTLPYYGIIPIGLSLIFLAVAGWMIKSHIQSRKHFHENDHINSINTDKHSDEPTPQSTPTTCCIRIFPTPNQQPSQPGGYAPIPTDDHLPTEEKKSCCAMM